MSVIDYQSGCRIDGSDETRLQREVRMRIQREAAERLAPLTETAAERHYRERTQQIAAAEQNRVEAQASEQRWNELFDARGHERLLDFLAPEDNYVNDAAGIALGQARIEMREHVGETVAELRSEIAALRRELAVMTERMKAPAPAPMVKAWRPETVCYAGEFYALDGSSWQVAKRHGDTARFERSLGDDCG
jgi:hypothetical protein